MKRLWRKAKKKSACPFFKKKYLKQHGTDFCLAQNDPKHPHDQLFLQDVGTTFRSISVSWPALLFFFSAFSLSLRNLHHMHSSVWISGQYRLPHTRHNPRLTQSYSVGLLLKCTVCKSPSLHFTALGRHAESDITQGIVPFAFATMPCYCGRTKPSVVRAMP